MFSNVTNQMSSWLGGVLKKEGEAAGGGAPEAPATSNSSAKPNKEQADVKGDGDSSATESADRESLTSGPDSPDVEEGERKPSVTEEVSAASTKAIQGAKTFGSYLFSSLNKAGAKLKETVEQSNPGNISIPILSNFHKEQEEFIKSKTNSEPPKREGLPPWVGHADEEVLKEQILALSGDKRNFLRSPPAGANFTYDTTLMQPIAEATLDEDPRLAKLRFELVPKIIKEEEFWRNYFYRVSLIQQSSELSSKARSETTVPPSESSPREKSKPSAESSTTGKSSVSSSSGPCANDLLAIRKSLEGLKASSNVSSSPGTDKEEDWEKELTAELQEYEVLSTASAQSKDRGHDELDKEIEDLLEDDDLK
ncbi:unnamed protein product [Cyprideis torosa]|uniref:Uncharacterized protein n=1 Tax=Cyprideis torosa TaxID=163714 RepID=A0A7R8WHU9_9CRUS|nr:unnamed protein product [Cyprideis torosa]CAG0899854.1 unnamed protein product [Cyprideis torosa]